MTPLTDTEKRILALALFGYAMRAGPGQFVSINEIAHKLGVQIQYEDYAKSWIAAAKTDEQPKGPIINDAQADDQATAALKIAAELVNTYTTQP